MKNFYVLLGLLLFVPAIAFSQLSVTTADVSNLIDFDNTVAGVNEGAFDGSGFMMTPVTGQLDADGWAVTGMSDGDKDFGVENTTGDHARGNTDGGLVTTGGMYSFNTSEGVSIGFQSTGSDFTPGTIALKVDNNTGAEMTSVSLEYDILVYNDQTRSNSVTISYSSDNITYTEVTGEMYATTVLASPSPDWEIYHRIVTFNLTLADAESVYLMWTFDDKGGESSRDEIALDNIDVVLSATPASDCGPISSFPWSEDFESYSDLSELIDVCWEARYGFISDESQLTEDDNFNYFYISDFANGASNNSMVVNLYDEAAHDWVITPAFDLGDGSTNYMLELDIALTEYYSATQGAFEEDDYYAFVVSTDGGDTWSELNVVDAIDSDNDGIPAAGTHYIADLTGLTGIVKFGIYGVSTLNGPEDYDIEIFVDNLMISELSGCLDPFGAGSYVVDASSVYIDWEDLLEGSNLYNLEYGTASFTQGTGTLVEGISVTEYLIQELTFGDYDVYIQADCGGGSTSSWVGPISFTLEAGGSCATAFDYGMINDPTVSNTIESLEEVWYYVTLDTDYDNVLFSTCGSLFDTKMSVFVECDEQIGYNDDDELGLCGINNESTIFYPHLPAGVYQVRINGYDADSYGDFDLTITSDEPIPHLMYSGDAFYESISNDGTISTVIYVELENDTFTDVDVDFTDGFEYTSYGVPTSLNMVVHTLTETTATITLTGTADSHTTADNTLVEIEFDDIAFTTYAAGDVVNYFAGFNLVFTDEVLVVDLALIEPQSGYACNVDDQTHVPYQLENVGTAPIASGTPIGIIFESESVVIVDEPIMLTEDLLPSETFEGLTVGTVDLSTIGATYFKAYIDFAPDSDHTNDTLNGWVVHFMQDVSFPDDDDMNDTIIVGAYPYTIDADVAYTPDSAFLASNTNWQWVGGPMADTYEVSTDGWYYIEVETVGCWTLDSVYVKLMTPAELAVNDLNLNIYPNPASENFVVEYSSAESGNLNIYILTVDGKVIETRSYDFDGEIRESFDISDYAPGMYIVRFNNNGKTINKRLIKN